MTLRNVTRGFVTQIIARRFFMKIFAPIAISIALVLPLNAQAEEPEKKFNLGIGTYALNLSYSNAFMSDDEFRGYGLNALYAFTDNFAIRGEYYSLEHDDFSDFEVTGIDLVAYFGTGLATHGFKAYIGGGLYSETWSLPGVNDEKFRGVQLNGGLGYNWDVIALDLVLGVRGTSDYEELFQDAGINTDVTAVSGSLILSARF